MGTGYTGTTWQALWVDQDRQYTWKLEFAFIPRKTEYNKWVWFRKVYRGTRIIHGPGTPAILYKWMTPEEFTWYQLTAKTVK